MSILLVASVAVGVGWFVGRWWLLALPLGMVAVATVLPVVSETSIAHDNPLLFLALLLGAGFAAGVLGGTVGRRRSRTGLLNGSVTSEIA